MLLFFESDYKFVLVDPLACEMKQIKSYSFQRILESSK